MIYTTLRNRFTNTKMTRYNCNNRDEKFAQIALNEAGKSTMQQNHGCVAVMGGRVVAKGFNSDRCYSSDGFLLNTCSCHAEIDVMRRLDRILRKKSLSSARNKRQCFLRKGQLVRCKKKQGTSAKGGG